MCPTSFAISHLSFQRPPTLCRWSFSFKLSRAADRFGARRGFFAANVRSKLKTTDVQSVVSGNGE